MLFMVELVHGPDKCPAVHPVIAAGSASHLAGLEQTASEHGARIVGGWSFPVGHKLWYVVEADDSSAVSDLFFAAQAHHWSTVTINPVIDHETFKERVLGATD